MRKLLPILLVAACAPPPPADEPTGIVVRSPSGACSDDCLHDLGELPIEVEARVALSVANLGSEPVEDVTVAFVEGDPTFAITQAPLTTIAGRRTSPFLVSLKARAPSQLRAELMVTADDDQIVRLELAATVTGDGIVLGDNRVCDFGQVPVGESSAPCAVTFVNGSSTALQLEYISVLPNIYSIEPAFSEPIPLAPLEEHTIEIRATPVEPGRTFGSFAYGYEDRIVGGGVSLSVEGI